MAALFADVIARGVVTRDERDRLAPIVPSKIGLTGDERALYTDEWIYPYAPCIC